MAAVILLHIELKYVYVLLKKCIWKSNQSLGFSKCVCSNTCLYAAATSAGQCNKLYCEILMPLQHLHGAIFLESINLNSHWTKDISSKTYHFLKNEVRDMFVPAHIMETQDVWRSKSIYLVQINGQLHVPATLSSGKESPCTTEDEAGRRAQESYWILRRRIFSWTSRISKPGSSAFQPVA
jgi:hypothetical protein